MKDNSLILAVDRNERNLGLLAQFLDKEGYEILKVDSFERLSKPWCSPPMIQRVALTHSQPANKFKDEPDSTPPRANREPPPIVGVAG
ncbi:MAG TPA: hypothetical protein V6D43_10200 [Candidatus Sericytochromatia bacterium]